MDANDEAGRRIPPPATTPASLAKCALRRQTPAVGAECPNWARSDLCGGRSAMGVPTANEFHAQDLPRPTKQKFSKRAAASDVSGHPRLWGRRGMGRQPCRDCHAVGSIYANI